VGADKNMENIKGKNGLCLEIKKRASFDKGMRLSILFIVQSAMTGIAAALILFQKYGFNSFVAMFLF
jgi:hypothetical protein